MYYITVGISLLYQ